MNRLEVMLSKLQTITLDVLVSHSLIVIALVKATFVVICLTILLCKLDQENYILLTICHDQSDLKIENGSGIQKKKKKKVGNLTSISEHL